MQIRTLLTPYDGAGRITRQTLGNIARGMTPATDYNGKHGNARVSEHTPNGVAVHHYTIYLCIIEEEDGLFKVSKTDMFSGY